VLFELRMRFVEIQNGPGAAAAETKSRIILP
jgi:hypothetical protein